MYVCKICEYSTVRMAQAIDPRPVLPAVAILYVRTCDFPPIPTTSMYYERLPRSFCISRSALRQVHRHVFLIHSSIN